MSRCGVSGWGLRPRHLPYRFHIGGRPWVLGLRGRGSSGGWIGVSVGVGAVVLSGVGVRSRWLGNGAGIAHRVPHGVRGCGCSGVGGGSVGVVGGVVSDGVGDGVHAIGVSK